MATKKEPKKESTIDTTATTVVTLSDSEVIAIQLRGSIIYPKNGKANVTAEQLVQLKEMGSVE